MRRLHIVTASAVVAVAAAVIALAGHNGYFNSVPDVTWGIKVPGPQLLLPSAEKGEARRLRVLDEFGGAIDTVDLTSGFVREVHFVDVRENRRSVEYTFFPPVEGQPRKLYSERKFSESGLGTFSETYYDLGGRVVKTGAMTLNDKTWEYFVTTYNGLGNADNREIRNLKGEVLGKTVFRDNGVAEYSIRYGSTYTQEYFRKEYYAADGVTVAWKEDRSFGNYTVTRNWEGSNLPREISENTPSKAKVTHYRPDGTMLSSFEDFANYGLTYIDYDARGEVLIERFFRPAEAGKGNVTGPDGKRYALTRLVFVDPGHSKVGYYWTDTGAIEQVQLWAGPDRPLRIDYRWERNGTVKRIEFNDKNSYDKTFENVSERPDVIDRPEWRVMPAKPYIEATRVDVSDEVYRMGGMQ